MKLVLSIAFAAVLAIGLASCDSADVAEELTHEALAGVWAVERASLRIGGAANVDVLSALEADDNVTMTFASRGAYTATVEVAEPRNLTIPGTGLGITIDNGSIAGSYQLLEGRRIQFTLDGVPGAADVEYRYRTRAAGNELVLTVPMTEGARAILAELIGSTELAALVTGAEITLRQASSATN